VRSRWPRASARAWGSEDKLRERIKAHRKAGATHVCVLPLRSDGAMVPDESALEAMAPRK
jgi:hypothetical protein